MSEAKKTRYGMASLLTFNLPKVIVDLLTDVETTDVYLAGGAIRDFIISGSKLANVKDFDIFFKNEEAFIRTITYFTEVGAERLADSPNAVNFKYNEHEIQLINRRYFPTVEECISDFDFRFCQFGFVGGQLVYYTEALNDIYEKKIVYTAVDRDDEWKPGSIIRAFKFASKYGFEVSRNDILDLVYKCIQDIPEQTSAVKTTSLEDLIQLPRRWTVGNVEEQDEDEDEWNGAEPDGHEEHLRYKARAREVENNAKKLNKNKASYVILKERYNSYPHRGNSGAV